MAQSLNKAVGGSLLSSQARKWIQNYKDKNPGDVESIFYGSDLINAILSQSECVGIRTHFAIDDAGQKQLILVGAKENGNNIWPSSAEDTAPNGIMGDHGWPCPPVCNGNDIE
ncbi:MAG: hypothetical protein WDN75_20260, partial [Bacteroidota bacterium]